MTILTRTMILIKTILQSALARMWQLVSGQNFLFFSGMLQEEQPQQLDSEISTWTKYKWSKVW